MHALHALQLCCPVGKQQFFWDDKYSAHTATGVRKRVLRVFSVVLYCYTDKATDPDTAGVC